MTIRDYDPKLGQAFQGDVAIVPVPNGIAIATTDEIRPAGGRLILQEGEVTGHHHQITLDPSQGRAANFRPADAALADPLAAASPELRRRLAGGGRKQAAPGSAQSAARGQARTAPEGRTGKARMYRDPAAAQAMVEAGLLERGDLCVGFLVVEDGAVIVRHEEHDGLRLPAGRYYVGRQVESVGAEERAVQD